MSLSDWQRGVAWTLTRAASPQSRHAELAAAIAALPLAPAERTSLAALAGAPGFAMTCYIQRWWRATKLESTLRLTTAALQAARLPVMDAYLDQRPCSSLFFLPEALGFLDFVATLGDRHGPHLQPFAAFERAFLLCQELATRFRAPAPPAPGAMVHVHPAAALIKFEAPVAELFPAVLAGQPLPEPGDAPAWILVAPGLPRLWREATPEERAVLTELAVAPAPVPASGAPAPWAELLAAGAIEASPSAQQTP